MNRSCCIFFYEGYVSIAPTIINLAKSLSEQGYSVFIYATKSNYPIYKIPNEKINTVYFSKGYNIPAINNFYNFLKRIKIGNFIKVIELLLFLLQSVIYTFKNFSLILPGNSIVIGVDTNGSIASLLNFYFFRRKFAYLSLEINSLKDFPRLTRPIKYLERYAYRKSECVLIQDEDRFKSICEFNKYEHNNVFYLPNSPMPLDSHCQNINDSNYFRKIFNLGEDKFSCLIIQAGMISDNVFCQELASAFSLINNGSALIFHEGRKRNPQEQYIQQLKKINSHNLFISLDPLPVEEIDKVFSSATIGLAFYRNINNNFSQIAKASGKLAHYLQHGKPVLVNNLDSLSSLVDEYKIGVAIQNPSDPIEIQSAIELILSNYNFYCENAKICFAEEFDFTSKVKPFMSYIKNW